MQSEEVSPEQPRIAPILYPRAEGTGHFFLASRIKLLMLELHSVILRTLHPITHLIILISYKLNSFPGLKCINLCVYLLVTV